MLAILVATRLFGYANESLSPELEKGLSGGSVHVSMLHRCARQQVGEGGDVGQSSVFV